LFLQSDEHGPLTICDETDIALVKNNAVIGAQIAVELAKIKNATPV
jgi:hypothetical protein